MNEPKAETYLLEPKNYIQVCVLKSYPHCSSQVIYIDKVSINLALSTK
jgi:hypothetical protein